MMIGMTLCYLIDGSRWLMLLRNKKKNDINEGKWIGVGGKIEAGETPEEGMRREILEETGLTCEELTPRGILHFYSPQEDDLIYVYTSRKFRGHLTATREGTLEWVEENEIMKLNLWEGDRIFLQRMMDSDEPFELEMHYDADGKLLHWNERKENFR